MRVLYGIYLLVIVAGLVLYLVIGLLGSDATASPATTGWGSSSARSSSPR